MEYKIHIYSAEISCVKTHKNYFELNRYSTKFKVALWGKLVYRGVLVTSLKAQFSDMYEEK